MKERLWEVPSTWEWSVVGALGHVVSGGTPSTKIPEYWGGEIIWFAPSDLTGYGQKFIARGAKTLTEEGLSKSSAKLMPAGSVMFSSRAPIGYVAINSDPSATNQGFKSIVPHMELFNEYIYHYLRSAKRIAEERSSGTTFKELSGSAFSALPIPIAPVNEQRRIVEKIEALFDEIDRGVESLRAAKSTIHLYRQSLLKSAFEGRLTAEWRAQNPDKLESPDALIARIRDERAARYQATLQEWKRAISEWRQGGGKGRKPAKPKQPKRYSLDRSDLQLAFPELPHGWAWSLLGRCSMAPEYGTAAKSSPEGEVPVVRMGNIQNGRINWSNLVYTSDKEEIAQYSLQPGDVLFNRTNSPELVGKTAIYRGERPALFAGYLVRVNQITRVASGPYVAYFLNSPQAREHGKSIKTDGVNQSNINGTKLQEYPFPICSTAEQAEIVRILDARLEAAETLGAEVDASLTRAEALRQSILKKAFAGELVPQDPADEPASSLLARIQAERAEAPARRRTKRVVVEVRA